MKKITFLLFLFLSNIHAQNTSTGQVTLTSDFTVQFDVDGTNDLVTMTMIGPSNIWLGVALNTNYSPGNGMSNAGKDVLLYTSSGLVDASFTGSNATPNTTEAQNWTLISDNVAGSTRTVIASRVLDTGDSSDYIFTTDTGNLSMMWAKGSSLSLAYHSGGRGGAIGTFALSTPYLAQTEFTVYPNPTTEVLNFEFPNGFQKAQVKVLDILGHVVFQTELTPQRSTIISSAWSPGLYLVQIVSGDYIESKRVIKY